LPENAQISHDYREVEALRRSAQLQQEVTKRWNPPFGASSECTCQIEVRINAQGKVAELKIIKSSGMLLYDISAKQAVYSLAMPKWTYNKSITLNFKQ
jgi:TonB family protein